MSTRTTVSVVSAGLFLLSVPLLASAAVTFQGGWERGVLTGAGEWSNKQVMRPDSYQIVSDVVRTGTKAARVEVRPGDNPLTWCCSNTERSEVLFMTKPDGSMVNENSSSGTQYYGFSVRLDSTWAASTWATLFQLHGPDSYGTWASFELDARNDRFEVYMLGGDVTQVTSPTTYALSNSSLNRGKWVDFIVKITYASGPTGALTVWRRDEGQANFTQVVNAQNVPTLQYKSTEGTQVGAHYWKAGIYRNAESSTSILWNDGFVRADTYEEILNYFGTTTPPPPPPQDTTAPTVPTGLSATAASQTAVNLSWNASTDAVGVAGYRVFRNGTQVADSPGRTFSDTGLTAATMYSYTVAAYDAAGNFSAQSGAVSATTQSAAFALTVEAENFQTKSGGNGSVSGVWNLNSNGYISHPVTFPGTGTYTFDIVARGTKAAGAWANMRVSIDNVVKSNVTVDSTSLKTFRVKVANVTAGQHVLKLEFTNDYYNEKKKEEDRNLLIDKVTIKNSTATGMITNVVFALADTMSVAGIKLTAIISAAMELLAGAQDTA
ncbi:MAG: heparin lyase I family protein [Candidatus Pacebacteria bacterium]|nr:heparin lyase I family protein [Candidatus Paceibacterota bacterium]